MHLLQTSVRKARAFRPINNFQRMEFSPSCRSIPILPRSTTFSCARSRPSEPHEIELEGQIFFKMPSAKSISKSISSQPPRSPERTTKANSETALTQTPAPPQMSVVYPPHARKIWCQLMSSRQPRNKSVPPKTLVWVFGS